MDTLTNLFQPLSNALFWVLELLHNSLGISWSWSIVLLTVIVRIVLVPLTWRQLKSMRAMQALAPQIKELQQKYKDDRQLLNQKTMEFYSENKVSPFGSCLPLILQLPVFFGLFYMLRSAGMPVPGGEDPPASAGAFAPGSEDYPVSWLWIGDITQFDIILMFLYIASQFVASWQMAKNGGSQQKMIAYFMPVMVGIFMFVGKWPAGLMIYWFTSNLWTIAQQYVAEKVLPLPAVVAAGAGGKDGKSVPAKATSGKPGKTGGGKAATGKASAGKAPPPGKGAQPKSHPSKPGVAKAGAGKSGTAKSGAATAGTVKTAPAAGGSADAPATAKSTSAKSIPAQTSSGKKPAGKSGGKSSVQKTGKQGKTTTGQGERPDGGAGGTEGPS